MNPTTYKYIVGIKFVLKMPLKKRTTKSNLQKYLDNIPYYNLT